MPATHIEPRNGQPIPKSLMKTRGSLRLRSGTCTYMIALGRPKVDAAMEARVRAAKLAGVGVSAVQRIIAAGSQRA